MIARRFSKHSSRPKNCWACGQPQPLGGLESGKQIPKKKKKYENQKVEGKTKEKCYTSNDLLKRNIFKAHTWMNGQQVLDLNSNNMGHE